MIDHLATPEPDESCAEAGDGTNVADEALLRRIAQGDRTAFATVFSRYAGRIKGFLMRAGAAESVAEDAAQEVMVAVWRRAGQFDPTRAAAATWIFTIARNKRIDLARQEARIRAGLEADPVPPEPVPPAERGLTSAERARRVRDALRALSSDQIAVVRLSFFSELSHSEIAAELGLPLGTVKSRLRLAFQRLRSELGADFALELTDD